MSKHTPGPWEVSGGDIWPVNGNPRVKIATTTKPAAMNGIDWQANAQLIAATPELLEALKEAVDIIQKHTRPGPDKPYTPWTRAEEFKKIIAKAEGK